MRLSREEVKERAEYVLGVMEKTNLHTHKNISILTGFRELTIKELRRLDDDVDNKFKIYYLKKFRELKTILILQTKGHYAISALSSHRGNTLIKLELVLYYIKPKLMVQKRILKSLGFSKIRTHVATK